MKINVIEFFDVYVKFGVNLVRKFRVLHTLPNCWEEVTSCTTEHSAYESGITTIYQSKTTKKYYMVRYFDGCFNQMYAEVSGIDWKQLKNTIHDFWKVQSLIHKEMWHLCDSGEMTYKEKNIRVGKMRKQSELILLGMVA